MENLFRDPKITLNAVSLVGVQRFIEAIPVPEGTFYLIKSISNALSYKFTVIETDFPERRVGVLFCKFLFVVGIDFYICVLV